MSTVIDSGFKSTLPPRKRAKTQAEKEQRRVERILRNRRAAHASREKKRKHVEYLESYVLKLEANMDLLKSNFNAVFALLDSKSRNSIDLKQLCDVDELKEKIHLNLNSSVAAADDEDEEEPPSVKKRKVCVDQSSSPDASPAEDYKEPASPVVSLKQEPVSPQGLSHTIKHEPVSPQGLLSVKQEQTYYNYLSPISINSPINSPIDLTLTKSTQRLPSLDTTTSMTKTNSTTHDSMGQNSEVILFHDVSSVCSPYASFEAFISALLVF